MTTPSPTPVRFPAGVSTQPQYGPLGAYGQPDPFGYHQWTEDFNVLSTFYTATKTNAGTMALTAGDGGLLLYTTDALAGDLCSLQLAVASFSYTAGKKLFFATRLKVSSAANATFLAGLIQTTTTPGTVTDGIYFQKLTGAANTLSINHTVGSVTKTLAIPTAAYTLADATFIDLSFHVTRGGDILTYVGSQLFGYVDQSYQTAGLARGEVARLQPTGGTFTAVNLNPTVALISGTATAKTMTVDFAMAAKER